MHHPRLLALLTAIAVIPAAGCYAGLEGTTAGADGSAGGSADDDNGSDSGDDVSPQCRDVSTAGPARLRRLTRSAYDNAVRDLLGTDLAPATRFEPDDVIGGFEANVLSGVTDLAVEEYMRAAEDLAADAVTGIDSLVACDPGPDPQGCAASFIDSFGRRAWRRPLAQAERGALLELHGTGDDFVDGVELVITATLQSPNFLYLPELGPPPGADPGAEDVIALSGYEIATKLSLLVWNTIPSEDLLDRAAAGEFDDPEGIRAAAEQMLDDPRAVGAMARFHGQWLGLEGIEDLGVPPLDEASKDTDLFPAFDGVLRDSMRTELELLTDYTLRSGDGKLRTLLTSDVGFVDEGLAGVYGVDPAVDAASLDPAPQLPPGFTAVHFDPSQRAGILTSVALMTVLGKANQTDLVHRGAFVRERLLCTLLAPAPSDVDNTPPEPDPDATTREQYRQHSEDPRCAGCHVLTDPLGFGFENYDAIGAYRTTEVGGQPVDAAGELTGADVTGPFEGAVELAHMLADSTDVRDCVAQTWYRYMTATALDAEDDGQRCGMEGLQRSFADSDGDLRQLVLSLVTTDAFRLRRAN